MLKTQTLCSMVHSMGQKLCAGLKKTFHTSLLYKLKDSQHKTFIQIWIIFHSVSHTSHLITQIHKCVYCIKKFIRNKSSVLKNEMDHKPKIRVWLKFVPIPVYIRSVSPLSGAEDGAGVTVSLSLLVSFPLTAGRRAVLRGFVAFEKVATRPEDLFFELLVALHVGEHLVEPSSSLHRGTSGGACKKIQSKIWLNIKI